MAFCRQCGSPVEGDFCSKCGARFEVPNAPGAPPPPPPPPAASPVVLPPPTAPASKKGRLILWSLGGCAGLIVIIVLVMFFGSVYFFKKAGIDPDLMKRNPELAVAKMITTMNPDIEVVSIDDKRGIIRARDKKTGKTLTIDLQNAKQGKIVFSDDENQKMEIQSQGEGDNASMEIKSSDGSINLGAGAASRLPSWLPPYPGAEVSGGMAFNTGKGNTGSCTLKTKDSLNAVSAFYEKALKDAGFDVQRSSTQIPGQGNVVILSASDSRNQRTVNVTSARTQEGTTVDLTFEGK